MFANQSALTDADLDGYAQVIGLDLVQFDADRSSQEIADEVAQDKALGVSLGVDARPTFSSLGRGSWATSPSRVPESHRDSALTSTSPSRTVRWPRGARRPHRSRESRWLRQPPACFQWTQPPITVLGKTVIRQEEAQPAQRALEVGRVVHGGGQPGVEICVGLGLTDGHA